MDLRGGALPAIKIGLARDLSDGTIDQVLGVLEDMLRRGDVTVCTAPGAALPDLVGRGSIDLGLAVRWPSSATTTESDVETLPLGTEELVVVGGPGSVDDPMPVSELANRLIVAGPHPEYEEGVLRLLAAETPTPILAHTVGDVLIGLRIASITGGAMVLPRSMARAAGLAVRPFDPPVAVDTVLLARTERAADEEVFSIVVGLHEALGAAEGAAPAVPRSPLSNASLD